MFRIPLLSFIAPKQQHFQIQRQAWTRVLGLKGLPGSRKMPSRLYTTNRADLGPGTEVHGLTRRTIEAIVKRMGYTAEFPSPNLLRIDLPALSHEAFDTQGQRQIACYLMKLFDLSMFYWPTPAKDLDEQLMLYMLNYAMTISPSLYDDSPKRHLVLANKMNFVKRSSFCCEIDMVQDGQSVPMASSRFLEINIDPVERRPAAIPQWWKDENGFPEEGRGPEIDDVVKPDKGVVTTERRIHYTDTDNNNHTNFTTYVRMCLDSFYESVLNNKYPNNNLFIFMRGWVKKVTIVFKSETVLGDILTIESWEDEEFHDTFHFEIKNGQTTAASVSLAFYDSLTENEP